MNNIKKKSLAALSKSYDIFRSVSTNKHFNTLSSIFIPQPILGILSSETQKVKQNAF